ncbi:MAG TPA: hypothetical protein VFB45_23870 [Pseudolabrys sp.]|nr:hypothetical protein [Pseudolabrys sp.]
MHFANGKTFVTAVLSAADVVRCRWGAALNCSHALTVLMCVVMASWPPSGAFADCVGPGLGGGCTGAGRGVVHYNGGGGGGYDVGAMINAGIAIMNAAGPLLNDLGNMANNAAANAPTIQMPALPEPALVPPANFPDPFQIMNGMFQPPPDQESTARKTADSVRRKAKARSARQSGSHVAQVPRRAPAAVPPRSASPSWPHGAPVPVRASTQQAAVAPPQSVQQSRPHIAFVPVRAPTQQTAFASLQSTRQSGPPIAPVPARAKDATTKPANCSGDTSNGCTLNQSPNSNRPISVVIGRPDQNSGSVAPNNSRGERNVPTPCQDRSGPSGCNTGSTMPKAADAPVQLKGSLERGQLPSPQLGQASRPEVPGVSLPAPPIIADNDSCAAGYTRVQGNPGCVRCSDFFGAQAPDDCAAGAGQPVTSRADLGTPDKTQKSLHSQCVAFDRAQTKDIGSCPDTNERFYRTVVISKCGRDVQFTYGKQMATTVHGNFSMSVCGYPKDEELKLVKLPGDPP